jgi:hypothetical protein
MDTAQTRRPLPTFQFRVLVIGRANAGKTSILQRVCETTESPTIYRGNEVVCGSNFCPQVGSYYSGCQQVTLNPTMNVSDPGTSLRLPLNMKLARRAPHRRRARVLQSQGLCFSRLAGNRGRRRGDTQDLERFYSTQVRRNESARQIARNMVRLVSTITTTNYHTFRYCVPMDGHRPGLDLRFYKNICPDQNGASSLTVMTVFNATTFKFLS